MIFLQDRISTYVLHLCGRLMIFLRMEYYLDGVRLVDWPVWFAYLIQRHSI